MPGRRTLRLFVACAMPEDVKRGLASIQDDLRQHGPPRLRYVRPEGIHITLKFLGDVQQHRVEAIASALGRAVEPFELRLTIDRLGGFPPALRFARGQAPAGRQSGSGAVLRVVWAALVAHWDELTALYLEEMPSGTAPRLRRLLARPRDRRQL